MIQRINAASRANGMTTTASSRALRAAEIEVDRRMLADMAVNDPAAFAVLVGVARDAVVTDSSAA